MKKFLSVVLAVSLILGIFPLGVCAADKSEPKLIISSTIEDKNTNYLETVEIYRTDRKTGGFLTFTKYECTIEFILSIEDESGIKGYTKSFTYDYRWSLIKPGLEEVFTSKKGFDEIYKLLEEKQIYDYIMSTTASLGESVTEENDRVADAYVDEAKAKAWDEFIGAAHGFVSGFKNSVDYQNGKVDYKDIYDDIVDIASKFIEALQLEIDNRKEKKGISDDAAKDADDTPDPSKYASGIAETIAFAYKVFLYKMTHHLSDEITIGTDAVTADFHRAIKNILIEPQ